MQYFINTRLRFFFAFFTQHALRFIKHCFRVEQSFFLQTNNRPISKYMILADVQSYVRLSRWINSHAVCMDPFNALAFSNSGRISENS